MAKSGWGGAGGGAGRSAMPELPPTVGDAVTVTVPGQGGRPERVQGLLISDVNGRVIVQAGDREVETVRANLEVVRRGGGEESAFARQRGYAAERARTIRGLEQASQRAADAHRATMEQMQAMRDRKPRGLRRTYGTQATDEQKAEYAQREKEWNRRYRQLAKQQKRLLQESNEAYDRLQKVKAGA